jgi:hypothetical protein
MKNLLMKELRLALHPTNIIFLSLSAMLLIPNYPYLITFFYTTLGLFFLCLNGRENHDIEFTLALPVRKREIVTARICFSVLVELAQLALAAACMVLRNRLIPTANEVGMEANLALLGMGFLLLGLFNAIFFPVYYANPAKVGRAFVLGSTAVMVFIVLAEGLTHVAPFFRDVLDTPDPAHLGAKLAVLGIGVACFALLTLLAARVSASRFESLDL